MPTWPDPPNGVAEDDIDDLIDAGYLLCGTPEEVCEQLKAFEGVGIDQLCFGVPNGSSYEETLEMIELFGKHVIPEFDDRPDVVSTDVYRARAVPKFPAFANPPPAVDTIWTTRR